MFQYPGEKEEISTYVQATLFPELDRRLARSMPRPQKKKRLPIETALDLFPRIETQLVFEDFFSGFSTG